MSPDSPLAPPGGGGEASGSTFDQRGQQVQTQINIAGDVKLASVDGWLPYDASVELVAHAPPADFVARTGPFEEARRWLLDPGKALVAIVGPGGFGKTTLVQALCQDEAVRERFAAGMRWVQLAEEPSDLLGVISDLVVRLGRPRPDFRTIENATKALIEALGEQTLLLVIDNVWRVEELTPLLKGGPNCVRLMTTRDPSLAPAGSHVVELDVMSEAEAVQLLTVDLPGAGELDAVGLARQLYCWPLLLRLIKGALHERLTYEVLSLAATWQSIRQDLTDFGMTAFDDPRDEATRDRAVRASLNISLNQLTADERAHYGELAIFPTAAIHWSALGRLWGMGLGQARTLCRKLQRLALLSLNEGTRTIRLQDVFRGYLQNEQQDKLVVLQQRFLDSYGLSRWVELPTDEPYLWDHLAYHLIASGREEELAGLFADDVWMQVRVMHDGYRYDGYVADLSRAWRIAHEQVRSTSNVREGAKQLAMCIQYALIRTSINALSSNYHPALVVRAVETGLWRIERGLSIAYRVVDPEKRGELIIALLKIKRCSAEQCVVATAQALETILTFQNEGFCTRILARLAPYLTKSLLKRGLEAALVLTDEKHRAKALAVLAPYLKADLLERGLEAALLLADEEHRAKALAALLSSLSNEQCVNAHGHWLKVALAFEHEASRFQVLKVLVPRLSDDLFELGLDATLGLKDRALRAQIFMMMSANLSGEQRRQALEEGLAATLALKDEGSRTHALAALISQLSGDLLERGLATTLTFKDKALRVQVLAALALHLSNDQRRQILEEGWATVQAIEDERSRTHALIALAPQLSGNLVEQGVAVTLALKDDGLLVRALTAVAPRLAGLASDQHKQILAKALTNVLAIEDERKRTYALAVLAPYLTDDLCEKCLTAVVALHAEDLRARLLAALAPQLSDALLRRGLAIALELPHEDSRIRALAALAPRLTNDLIEIGLTAALALQHEEFRSTALTALAPCLSGDLLVRSMAAMHVIYDEAEHVKALYVLAPYLTGDLLVRGMAAALAFKSEWVRAGVLAALAPRLTGDLVEQGMTAALAFEEKWGRAGVLVALAPRLTGDLAGQGLAAVFGLQEEQNRAEVLAALAPQLTGDLIRQGLTVALEIQNVGYRIKVLTKLLPHLSKEQRRQYLESGLEVILTLDDELNRVEALAMVAPQLSGDLLERSLTIALAMQHEATRARALAALAPQLSGDLLERGLDAALALHDGWYCTEALAALVPRLTGERHQQAIDRGWAAALGIPKERDRVEALAALATTLTGDLVERGLSAVYAFNEGWSRAAILVALAHCLTGVFLERGLAAALSIQAEEYRAWALAALARQLTGDLFERGLAAALALHHELLRARCLIDFCIRAPDRWMTYQAVQTAVVEHLWQNLQARQPEDVLDFLADRRIFVTPVIDTAASETIAKSILDICWKWRWV